MGCEERLAARHVKTGWNAVLKAVSVLLLAGLSACATGREYAQPELDLPQAWPEHVLLSEDDRLGWQAWWMRYNDPILDTLIARAVEDNLSIRLQVDRVREARARLGFTQADRYPTLGTQAEAMRAQQSLLLTPGAAGAAAPPAPGVLDQLIQIQEAWGRLNAPPGEGPSGLEALRGVAQGLQPPPSPPRRGPTANMFSISAVLGYELDLWGRLAHQEEAAEALLDQSVFAHDAVRLNVIADVVTAYFNLRSAQQQLGITERTVSAREELFALEEIRFEGGVTDALTLRQAESQLEAARARVPFQRERVLLLQSALAMLVGMTPAELMGELDFGEGTISGITLPRGVPESMPSEMLLRRPDIRAAEAALIATTAQIGVAEADRLPRVNLAAFLGTSALDLGDLFSGAARTWGMSSNLAGPLLDFGRNRMQVEAVEAQRDQAETQYQITVTAAFREVRDALVLFDTAAERVQAVNRQVDAVRETLRLAEIRYEAGFVSFIEVLDAQRTLLEAELLLVDARRDQLYATASLFKALGGGYS